MNVFKFNRILKNETFTASLINSLYENERKKKFLFHKSLDDLIRINYEEIIKNKYPNSLPFILNELYRRDSMSEFVKNKMMFNLIQASNSEFAVIINNNYGINWVDYIEDNIDELLQKLGCQKIQKLIVFSSKLSNETKNKINEFLKMVKEEYIEYLLFGKLKEYVGTIEYNDLLFLMTKLVEEVLIHEEKSFFDILKKNSGHYSEVIEIGTKIVKLSYNNMTYMIPYDKRLLIPIIRTNISKISNLNIILEVTEKVDCVSFIYKKNVKSLYNDMRKRGIIVADMKVENIGILLRENKSHWKYNICDELINKGIYNINEEVEVLQTGEKVIVDLDYIYDATKKGIIWANYQSKEFELQYEQRISPNGNSGKQKVKRRNK